MSILCKWEEGWWEKTEGGSEQKGGEGGEVEWKWICVCALQSIFVCLSICRRAAQSAINLTSSWQRECLVVWHCVCELESGWYHQFLYWKHTGKLEPFKCYMASWKEQQLNCTLVEVFCPVRASSLFMLSFHLFLNGWTWIKSFHDFPGQRFIVMDVFRSLHWTWKCYFFKWKKISINIRKF